mgnify:CR=1 FL=1
MCHALESAACASDLSDSATRWLKDFRVFVSLCGGTIKPPGRTVRIIGVAFDLLSSCFNCARLVQPALAAGFRVRTGGSREPVRPGHDLRRGGVGTCSAAT